MKKAFITGVTGQDGSYLSELLLSKGYQVYGLARVSSVRNMPRINHLTENPDFHICIGDVTDALSLSNVIKSIQPDEIYNLAALSQVKKSFELPVQTANIDAVGTVNMLETVRSLNLINKVRFYQASTSELYGNNMTEIQNEKTVFMPQSPYACSKLYSYWMTVIYRNSYKMFASNGILFNHESPRRGEDFVTRKITIAASQIKLGLREKLYLGNLSAKRDWGHSKDYVLGMWKILQNDTPDDFVLSTGVTTTIRDFCRKVFAKLDIPLEFKGEGADEKGYNIRTGRCIVEVDPQLYRPLDVNGLCGDCSKAKRILNWSPQYDLDALIDEMVEHDLRITGKLCSV